MKILVVDDQDETRLITGKILSNLGHQVLVAENGVVAWEIINNTKMDIIICDWLMPEMNGIELVKKIRASDFKHYIYLIMLTSLGMQEDRIEAIAAGADDFITKTTNPNELKVKLHPAERILNLKRDLDEQNAVLFESRKQLQDDLNRARTLQTGLLPAPIEDDAAQVEWLFHPATFIGGDFFNYYYIAPDLFIFYLVDISGHGVPSALMSMSVQTQLQAFDRLAIELINEGETPNIPENICTQLNKQMLSLSDSHDHYATLIYGLIDTKSRQVYMTSAGHPYPLHYHHGEKELETLACNGFPIGLLDSATYTTFTFKYKAGDKLFFYSDGINEMMLSGDTKVLTTGALASKLSSICEQNPKKIIGDIEHRWFDSSDMLAPPDDLSLVIMQLR
ncbi:MAG: sigma-B regulation protein RsbU (phosphoserine phosphatase) [Arenicella sp.]|jgi:sigma-B regulation protein RsbU (phosphoserine phosphatase)